MKNLNINNLTALWRQFSLSSNSFSETNDFAASIIPNTNYPNRIWVKKELSETILNQIKQKIQQHDSAITFSHFQENSKDNIKWIESNGFELNSKQYGMNLILSNNYEEANRLDFHLVQTAEDVAHWCKAFQLAFNYQIEEKTLLNSLTHLSCFNIILKNQIVGTVLLYLTDEVAGIHSLGVTPSNRGMGIARETMLFLLNYAKQHGAKQAVLQASVMAKSMYESLGFSHQFIQSNYHLISKTEL